MGIAIKIVASTVPAILAVFFGMSMHYNIINGKEALSGGLDYIFYVIIILFLAGMFFDCICSKKKHRYW